MSERICPYCKRGRLVTVQALENSVTTECSNCTRLLLLTKEGGNWRPIIDAVALGAGVVTLLHFFEVDSWDQLVDMLTDNI